MEWRIKKLENQILGRTSNVGITDKLLNNAIDRASIVDQLNTIAQQYKMFLDQNGEPYLKFKRSYDNYVSILSEMGQISKEGSERAQMELVLAYEDELVKHMENIKNMAELADKVLDVQKWPDLTEAKEKLDKLQTITKEQHLQSAALDNRTEEFIELYNEIINSFKNNTIVWDAKLEQHERLDLKIKDEHV